MEWAHRTFKINKLRSQTFQNLASSNDDPEETGLMLIVKSRSSIDVHQIDSEEVNMIDRIIKFLGISTSTYQK